MPYQDPLPVRVLFSLATSNTRLPADEPGRGQGKFRNGNPSAPAKHTKPARMNQYAVLPPKSGPGNKRMLVIRGDGVFLAA